jgi:hypothetical protein
MAQICDVNPEHVVETMRVPVQLSSRFWLSSAVSFFDAVSARKAIPECARLN